MRSKLLLSTLVSSLLLCSCSLFKTYSTSTKDVEVYLLEKAISDNYNNAKMGTISARFIDGEKYVPYFTLEQYASLFTPYLPENSSNDVTVKGSTATWTVSINNELYFASAISYTTGEILIAGDLSNALKSSLVKKDTKALTYHTKYEGEVIQLDGASNFEMHTFDNSSFKHFRIDGQTYYPLGFFDTTYSETAGLYHFYNYKNIYATQDAENFSTDFKDAEGNDTSSDKEMAAITDGEEIPQYLIDYNANLFIYMMDNFYGLKSYYKISSMKKYFRSYTSYNNLFTKDNFNRGDAYSSLLSTFDDNHTVLVSANSAWGEEKTQRYGGTRMVKRSALKKALIAQKIEMLKEYFANEEYDYDRGQWADTVMSQSGKTAMFYFDQFKFGKSEEVYNEDDSIKEGVEQYDSFFNFIKRLQQYESEGTVENVIIDISTNSGGVVGVMMRLLALISKNNSAELFMLQEKSSIVAANRLRIDVNGDGQYTDDEAFGNKFNFYMLTSDCSYSCGNAFPCYAQKMGIKTIGETTGGGECAVSIHYLPNSEYVYHSSNTHLGYCDKENRVFTGFESGAKPDISLVPAGAESLFVDNGLSAYTNNIPANFYDIEYLESLISAK